MRGTEKGRFEFGGSTIILCLPAGSAIIDPDILANTSAGFETRVKYGEKIGIHQTENALFYTCQIVLSRTIGNFAVEVTIV